MFDYGWRARRDTTCSEDLLATEHATPGETARSSMSMQLLADAIEAIKVDLQLGNFSRRSL